MIMRTGMAILAAMAATLALAMCSHRYGSVSEEGVKEAIMSPRLAITPHEPGWLLDQRRIHLLSEAQAAKTRTILQAGTVRSVPETYYRDAEQGNRGDTTSQLFYLYAENGQCLGGRVIGDKVYMDDMDLTEQQSKELYTLFLPALKKVLPKQASR